MATEITRENIGTEIARHLLERDAAVERRGSSPVTPGCGDRDLSGLEQFEQEFYPDLREIALEREAAFAASHLPRPVRRPAK